MAVCISMQTPTKATREQPKSSDGKAGRTEKKKKENSQLPPAFKREHPDAPKPFQKHKIEKFDPLVIPMHDPAYVAVGWSA